MIFKIGFDKDLSKPLDVSSRINFAEVVEVDRVGVRLPIHIPTQCAELWIVVAELKQHFSQIIPADARN